jgi:hypothetical protein
MQAMFSLSFANREAAGATLEKKPTPTVAAAEVRRNSRREHDDRDMAKTLGGK